MKSFHKWIRWKSLFINPMHNFLRMFSKAQQAWNPLLLCESLKALLMQLHPVLLLNHPSWPWKSFILIACCAAISGQKKTFFVARCVGRDRVGQQDFRDNPADGTLLANAGRCVIGFHRDPLPSSQWCGDGGGGPHPLWGGGAWNSIPGNTTLKNSSDPRWCREISNNSPGLLLERA